MSSGSEDGHRPGNVSTGPTTSSDPAKLASAKGKSLQRNHNLDPRDLRISGMAQLGLGASKALTGTPYASSHAPPFEYPFPSPGSASTSTSHGPFSSSMLSPGQLPVPFSPSLIARSHSYPVGTGKMQSLGLGFPIWAHQSTPQSSKLLSGKTEPPMPPTLKEKVSRKSSISSYPLATDAKDEEGAPKQPSNAEGFLDDCEKSLQVRVTMEGEISHDYASSSEASDVE